MTELELEAILAIQNRALFVNYDHKNKSFTGLAFSRTTKPFEANLYGDSNKNVSVKNIWLVEGNTREQVIERLAEKVFGGDSTNDA